MTITPVNLSRLKWAFRDLKSACEEVVSKLFITACDRCGKDALVEFVVRDGDVPTQIDYRCNCSGERLFKVPDERDKSLDRSFKKKKIPFWYPRDVILPIIQKERFRFIHELFTKRNLIALSTIFNAIEGLEEPKIREVMKLTFTAALDKCSRLKPLSSSRGNARPSLSEGWVAVRFYAPKMWQEVNPWHAFTRSFEKIYKGKKESNDKLRNAVMGSSFEELRAGGANVVIFNGSADNILNEQLPAKCVHYVLTDPPFGGHIQYLALSTFWGSWLKLDFDYDKELVINRHRGKTIEDYNHRLSDILKSIRRIIKPNNYVHLFANDVQGPYLHSFLTSMIQSKIKPERILHQPPPNSFGAAVRKGIGHSGSYLIRGRVVNKSSLGKYPVTEDSLRRRLSEAASEALEIRGDHTSIGTLLHSIYHKLDAEEILAFARFPSEKFIQESIKEFALIKCGQARIISPKEESKANEHNFRRIRTALLDATSLYVNNLKKINVKNQIYQSVLRRFEKSGTTIDDIRDVEQNITEWDVKEHRKNRLPRLLNHFGKLLDHECQLKSGPYDEVIWRPNKRKKVLFQVTDKEILVKAFLTNDEEQIESLVGTISYENLENALYKWCQNNPGKGKELIKDLNPMGKLTLPSPSPKHLLLKVLKNKELCPEHYSITLQIPRNLDLEPQPGQFFHVICDPDGNENLANNEGEGGYALTLRRPFSAHRIHYADFDRKLLVTPTIIPYEIKDVLKRTVAKIDILYKVVGKGTKSLSKVPRDSYLDVIGPIGRGFSIDKIETAVIVAGGIGVAPLVALAERLRYLGSKVFLYFGALKGELLKMLSDRSDSVLELGYANGTQAFFEVIKKEFTEIGAEDVRVCTDDGSLGEKGLVTDLLKHDIESGFLPHNNLTIYACGPSKMIKTISKVAREYKTPCQVLLEERMACGIGACLSCTCHVRGKSGVVERKRVCVDGPVFNSEEIVWKE